MVDGSAKTFSGGRRVGCARDSDEHRQLLALAEGGNGFEPCLGYVDAGVFNVFKLETALLRGQACSCGIFCGERRTWRSLGASASGW